MPRIDGLEVHAEFNQLLSVSLKKLFCFLFYILACWRQLEKQNIKIDYIAGTSMGADIIIVF